MAIATVVLAFLMGGVVIAATQHGGPGTRIHNTFVAYNQILDGAGLNWFGHFFRHPCLGFIPCHLASTSTAGAAQDFASVHRGAAVRGADPEGQRAAAQSGNPNR